MPELNRKEDAIRMELDLCWEVIVRNDWRWWNRYASLLAQLPEIKDGMPPA